MEVSSQEQSFWQRKREKERERKSKIECHSWSADMTDQTRRFVSPLLGPRVALTIEWMVSLWNANCCLVPTTHRLRSFSILDEKIVRRGRDLRWDILGGTLLLLFLSFPLSLPLSSSHSLFSFSLDVLIVSDIWNSFACENRIPFVPTYSQGIWKQGIWKRERERNWKREKEKKKEMKESIKLVTLFVWYFHHQFVSIIQYNQ